MTREAYEEELKKHEEGAFTSATDALFDAAYMLGMLGKESRFEGDDEIHEKLIELAGHYSYVIDEEIREGMFAREELIKLRRRG